MLTTRLTEAAGIGKGAITFSAAAAADDVVVVDGHVRRTALLSKAVVLSRLALTILLSQISSLPS